MKTIYLCGPIQDCNDVYMNRWREKATQELSVYFNILNPMRRNFRDSEFQSQNEIVQLDLKDVSDSDILLVNYSKPSVGTSMEVFFAQSQHKAVVTFTPLDYKDCSPWMVYHSTRVVKNVDEAIKYILKHFVEVPL